MSWTIDPAHTTVGFSAKHMGLSTVRGRFTAFRGEVDVDPADPTSARGHVEIDVASVDTGNEMRDNHLRSGDFFEAEKYPTIAFEVRSVAPKGNDEYEVTGDLTIKGVTKPVTLTYEQAGEGTDPYGNRKLGGSLSGTVNRNDWGLRWNVPLGGGGLLVGEKVRIEVDGQLAESKEAVAAGAEAEARA